MRTFIILALLAITLNHVYGGDIACTASSAKCLASNPGVLTGSCNDKFPFFKCLRDDNCSRDETVYQNQVKLYKYEDCGASAIIMGWTLPILMFSLAKYFSMH